MWIILVKSQKLFFTNFLLIKSIFVVLIVFLVGMAIDTIRQFTIEKLYLILIERNSDNIKDTFSKLEGGIIRKTKQIIHWVYG